jgi:hypothetical protein
MWDEDFWAHRPEISYKTVYVGFMVNKVELGSRLFAGNLVFSCKLRFHSHCVSGMDNYFVLVSRVWLQAGKAHEKIQIRIIK